MQPAALGRDRRVELRHEFTGEHVRLLVGKVQYILRLKDLSTTGLCALTDAPLALGERVFLLFEGEDGFEAEVRWIRKAFFGASLCEQLSLQTLHRLRRGRAGRARRK